VTPRRRGRRQRVRVRLRQSVGTSRSADVRREMKRAKAFSDATSARAGGVTHTHVLLLTHEHVCGRGPSCAASAAGGCNLRAPLRGGGTRAHRLHGRRRRGRRRRVGGRAVRHGARRQAGRGVQHRHGDAAAEGRAQRRGGACAAASACRGALLGRTRAAAERAAAANV
jgi:hypothetical protein